MKRGLSVIISTILLISFTVALGLIIMNWGGGLVEKTASRSDTRVGSELDCMDVKLKLEELGDEIIIKNNGEKVIEGYIVRKINPDGTVDVDEIGINSKIEPYGAGVYTNYEDIDKIEVIPRINIVENNEIVDCTNKIIGYTF